MCHKINFRYSKVTKTFIINENFKIEKLERLIIKSFNLEEDIIGIFNLNFKDLRMNRELYMI